MPDGASAIERVQQRKISGRLFAAYGTPYDGRKTEAGYGGRIGIVPQFAVAGHIAQLGAPPVRRFSGIRRLRWEYRPGSEIFIVYSDGRNMQGPGYAHLLNRTLAMKVTRLLRF